MTDRRMGRRRRKCTEMHLFFFSTRRLGRLIRMTGFAPVHVEYRERTVSVGYLVSRLVALPLI